MFSATSVCLSISALAIPLRNYLKTTFLLLVCSHSAPIPMLSELLLGLKTAWLTSTTCCLYFHPSPREEMYVKSSVFEVVCFYCYCGFFCGPGEKLSEIWSKKWKFFSDSSWQTESAVFPWWVAEHSSRVFQVQLQYYLLGGRWSYPIHSSVRVINKAPIARVSGGNQRQNYLWTWCKAPSREILDFWALLRLRSMYSVYGILNLWCMHIFSVINTLNHRYSLENRGCMLFWTFSYTPLCFVGFL